MNKEMEIPTSISQCGIDKDEYMASIDELADNALKDACTATNPRVPSKEDILKILIDLYD